MTRVPKTLYKRVKGYSGKYIGWKYRPFSFAICGPWVIDSISMADEIGTPEVLACEIMLLMPYIDCCELVLYELACE